MLWTPKTSLFQGPADLGDIRWFIEQIESLPTEKISLRVSDWAEKNRYLPSELTENPGPWDNSYAPFTIEIMDRLSPDDPARDVVVKKAGQMMITTAVIENWIGFIIDHAPGPSMYVTGSEELAKTSIELKLDKMIASSGIAHKIRATRRGSRQLSGNTTSRKDFLNGFLLAYGGKSTSRMRSVSIQNMIVDELDEIPAVLGSQGSAVELVRSRQRAFDKTRKTLFVSTPVLMGGPIDRLFLEGDQRVYHVPCKYCGIEQVLEFRAHREDGKAYGIYYELEEDDTLILSSVGYRCKNCLRDWKNYDKYDFLNAGQWTPTAKPINPFFYSYYLDGIYSPEYSWESLVGEWLRCWDSKNKRIKDLDALRVFQNTARGLGYEVRGEAPVYEKVVQHRRSVYMKGEIPNKNAIEETGSPILLLTAGADVHKNNIMVEVKGWCVNSCSYSIDWITFEGDTDNLNSPAWQGFRKLIEEKEYVSIDGKHYMIILTLIDASYRTDTVYEFCSAYDEGLFPIMGRDMMPKNARASLGFSEYNKHGLSAFNVNVSRYKDRIAAWLRRDWNTGELQPIGYPNYPHDYGDDFFRQYNAEEKREKFKRHGGPRIGFVWELKKGNLPNHSWDDFVYNAAALDMLCYNINLTELGQDRIDYAAFWDYIAENKRFYYESA